MLLHNDESQNKLNVSRFLSHATLGFDQELLNSVTEEGIEAWLKRELNQNLTSENSYGGLTREIWQHFRSAIVAEHGEQAVNGDGDNPALPYKWYFHMAWWHHTLSSNEHHIRQRVAQALSELLVISDNSVLELDALGMASYYDLLYKHAFGNYVDLLTDVSLHPCMGVYLSHMNNRKENAAEKVHPDENYARELMQLFTIGLFELHPDGSRQKDSHGNNIPTYDNRDIKELARVFTGLKASTYEYEWVTSFWDESYNGQPVGFGDGVDKRFKVPPFVNMTNPMKGDEQYHDRGAKGLLKGWINLQDNQSVQSEIQSVVRRLVAHPNTAPFVARHLINQLVSSNPSSLYIEAVADAFGKEGNLKAAVNTTLTYPLENPVMGEVLPGATHQFGKTVQAQKLKSPLLRATQVLKAFDVQNNSGRLWMIGDDIHEELQHHPLSAPTVFNFYKGNFVPHGVLEENGLIAPEFELHTSATAIGYVNLMYYWFFGDYLPSVSTQISKDQYQKNVAELDPDILAHSVDDKLSFDFSSEIALAQDPEKHDELIDKMSFLLTGKVDLPIKPLIKDAYKGFIDNPLWVVQTIAFMLSISPSFAIQEA